ncbi:MAG: DUF2155 domain-containing protein [Paracoccus sp. (in: a-proteobacteria)]|uniref:DUF2155 domain-containing protein n=1 Tax=Paracoccus sp. TaxID=267 RepID=UPI0039E48FEC
MIRKLSLCLFLAAMPALAQEEAQAPVDDSLLVDPALSEDPQAVAPAEPSAAERQAAVSRAHGPETARGQEAALRGLDKVTGQTHDFQLAPGQSVEFGRLDVRLGECRYPAADPTSDAYAELTIQDSKANRTVFSGWMIASSPAISALDDPRYDVWVISCDKA